MTGVRVLSSNLFAFVYFDNSFGIDRRLVDFQVFELFQIKLVEVLLFLLVKKGRDLRVTDQLFEGNSLVVIDDENPFKQVGQIFTDIFGVVYLKVF